MPSKSFLITALGLIAAAVIIYFVAFHESGESADKTTKTPTTSEPVSKKTDGAPTMATASAPRADTGKRDQIGATVLSNGGIEGIVTNPQGQPVAGARVELVKAATLNPFFQQAMRGQPKGNESKVYSTSSGVDGRYRLAAPSEENWRLTASHPDYAAVEHTNIATLPDSFLSFSITLKPGTRIYGRITEDQKNMPIVGAIVVLDDPGTAMAFPGSIDERRETVTDGSGQYEFKNVRAQRHAISVRAQTYGTVDKPIVNVPGTEPNYRFDVRMTAGKNISGRVLDANGHAVAKANVSAITLGLATSHGNAITNELGDFVVMDLEDGRYTLTADAGEAGKGSTNPQTPILAGTVDVEIRLAARSGAQGVVKDKSTGAPIAKFTIEVRRASANANARVMPRESGPYAFTDRKDGTFEVNGIEVEGEHALYAIAEGYSPGVSDRFSVQPGAVTRGVDIYLAKGGTVIGRVVDGRNNQPVGGASVRTRDNEWNDVGGALGPLGPLIDSIPQKTIDKTVTTDADGKFEFQNIPEGTLQLYVTHPSFTSFQQKQVVVNEGGKSDVGTLRMSTGCAVKGTVYGIDGAPAANAEINVQTRAQLGVQQKMVTKRIRSDAQGKYVVRTLPPGDYTITAFPSTVSENPFARIAEAKNTRKEITLIDGTEQEMDLFLSK
jgi:protocatechuate 3,4-dioxygenase beta subunit